MLKFETLYREKYDVFVRCYDTNKKESIIYKSKKKTRWFIPSKEKEKFSPLIKYHPFTDDEIYYLKEVDKKPDIDESFIYKIPVEVQEIKPFWETKNYHKNHNIWFLDIETTAFNDVDVHKADEEIVLIQIYDTSKKKMFVIGKEDFELSEYHKQDLEKKNIDIVYVKRDNESEILKAFFYFIKKLKPLLVLAWFGENFDFPYLVKRAKKLGFDVSNFSPFGAESSLTYDKDNDKYKLVTGGCHWYDYVDIYKKFTYTTERSYSLDYIAKKYTGYEKAQHKMFSTFDGFRTGDPDTYIFPKEKPKDGYELEMYNLQLQYKECNDTETKNILKKKIFKLANEYFTYYGIIDVFVFVEIEKKKKFLDIMFNITQKMGITYDKTLGTTSPWARYVELESLKMNKLLPPYLDIPDKETKLVGGFVQDPQIGLHGWLATIDINSAYPNLGMRGFNMSPETYIPKSKLPKDLFKKLSDMEFFDENDEKRFKHYLKNPKDFFELKNLLQKYNYSLSLNGAVFDRTNIGIIPKLVGEIYKERKEHKNKMIEYEILAEKEKNNEKKIEYELLSVDENLIQLALKILINAVFGALSNQYFRLFNIEIGRGITGNTRFYIRLLSHNINKKMSELFGEDDYILYGDTDSIFISLEKFVKKVKEKYGNLSDNEITDKIDAFMEKIIQPVVEKTNEELANIFNAYDVKNIKAEREKIGKGALFITKKRYAILVLDEEGVRFETPKIVRKGIDIVRSSTPSWIAEQLLEALRIILTEGEDEVRAYLKKMKKEITKQLISTITKVSSIGSLDYDLYKPKYDENGRKIAIPQQSKAALVTNEYIKNYNKQGTFTYITTQDKIHIVPLKQPNPAKFEVFAIKTTETDLINDLYDYIDWDAIWDKYVLSPIENLTKAIDIHIKQKPKLEIW